MHDRGAMSLRGREFVWGARTYLMAIVNVTPDSFSGDGRYEPSDAARHAMEQWERGADILDFGGESTRPGHEAVDAETEIARVVPAIAEIRARVPHAVISVDTYKPPVVRAARAAGADIVNSVWGAPPDLLETAAELEMPVVAMHNQRGVEYDGDVVGAVVRYLMDCAQRAIRAGIERSRIILDPGIGFGKTADQNIEVLRHLDRLAAAGYPVLVGASRKSTIGKLTGREARERVHGTTATTALAIASGADIVRVHDVAEARDAISVSDAIVRNWRPAAWIA